MMLQCSNSSCTELPTSQRINAISRVLKEVAEFEMKKSAKEVLQAKREHQ